MTIVWITPEERQRRAQDRREQCELRRLEEEFARWWCERAGDDGPIYVPELSSDARARLLPLLRPEGEPPERT